MVAYYEYIINSSLYKGLSMCPSIVLSIFPSMLLSQKQGCIHGCPSRVLVDRGSENYWKLSSNGWTDGQTKWPIESRSTQLKTRIEIKAKIDVFQHMKPRGGHKKSSLEASSHLYKRVCQLVCQSIFHEIQWWYRFFQWIKAKASQSYYHAIIPQGCIIGYMGLVKNRSWKTWDIHTNKRASFYFKDSIHFSNIK